MSTTATITPPTIDWGALNIFEANGVLVLAETNSYDTNTGKFAGTVIHHPTTTSQVGNYDADRLLSSYNQVLGTAEVIFDLG